MKTSDSIRNMRRGLIAIAIFFPGLYLIFAVISVLQNYQATIESVESDVRNISATLNEHAMRTIGEADSRLQSAIADIDRRALSMPGPEEFEIHNVLKWYKQQLPQAINLHAVDAEGWVRANSLTYPLEPINVRDRPYYQYHRDHTDPDLLISRPVKSRAGGKWAIPLTRRISHPDGSLKMIIVFGIDLDYFNNFYRALNMGEQSRILLVRQDGWVLMQTPLTDKVMDMNLANAPLFQQFKKTPVGIFQTDRAAIDNTARIVGYTSSTHYPLIATASMSRDYALQSWRKLTGQIAVIGVLSMAMLLGLIAMLWRRLNDLMATQNSLAQQNDALAKAERRYHELVDGIDGIVWEAEWPSVRFIYVSGNAAAISGYPASEWMSNQNFWHEKLLMDSDGNQVDAILSFNSHTAVLQPIEHHIFTPEGREIWLRSNISIAASSKNGMRLRGVSVDITKQRTSEKQLFQIAHFDQLTKLPNRQNMVDKINHAIAIAEQGGTWVGVMLMDMDQFKTINDSLGHEAGNQVLCQVAQRIQTCLRPNHTLARIGGDEFMLLIEEVDSGNVFAIEQLAERIATSVGEKIVLNDNQLYIGISMGISLFPQDGQNCETLMRNADTALHRAKDAGRNCWRFFDESMARHVARRLEIETALRGAIERSEWQLYYQPQQELESGKIIGSEALLRWLRPGVGMVSPLEFIPLAEESGMIVAIGNWVLQAACNQAVAWNRESNVNLRIAVNIAAKQIHHKGFVDQVCKALEDSGLPPHLLELEITESSIVENIEETVSKLRQIKALGVTVAIDDFGTGYSSLSYLKELPVDRLKIDQSFVRDIPLNMDDCAIVRTIIAMAKNLGLSVIAEGVESQEQIGFLQAEGCNEIQGFFISPPLEAGKFSQRYVALQIAPGPQLVTARRN